MLSERLMAIARKVPHSRMLLDVGTDHGFLPVFLVEQGIAERAIASDISEPSLNKARAYIAQRGLGDRIETRVGNGLSVVKPGEVDTVLIAGMGGLLIRDILEQGREVALKAQTFVLQPMTAQDLLRKWLIGNHFRIVDEVLAKEGERIYEVIVAKHGDQEAPEEIYYEIGRKLIENQDPLLEEFVLKKIAKAREILNKLRGQNTENAQRSYEEFYKKLLKYEEVYKWDVRFKKS